MKIELKRVTSHNVYRVAAGSKFGVQPKYGDPFVSRFDGGPS